MGLFGLIKPTLLGRGNCHFWQFVEVKPFRLVAVEIAILCPSLLKDIRRERLRASVLATLKADRACRCHTSWICSS